MHFSGYFLVSEIILNNSLHLSLFYIDKTDFQQNNYWIDVSFIVFFNLLSQLIIPILMWIYPRVSFLFSLFYFDSTLISAFYYHVSLLKYSAFLAVHKTHSKLTPRELAYTIIQTLQPATLQYQNKQRKWYTMNLVLRSI